MDGGTRKRLKELVDKLTDKKALALDPDLLTQVKHLCRSSDPAVREVHELLMQRLKDTNAQVLASAAASCPLPQQSCQLFKACCLAHPSSSWMVTSTAAETWRWTG